PVAVTDEANGDAPLTRRQVREQEKARTGSVSVIGAEEAEAVPSAEPADEAEAAAAAQVEEEAPQQEEAPAVAAAEAPVELVSGVPDFARTVDVDDDEDDDVDDEVAVAPVSAAVAADTVG
ncbi:hypothetical protein ACNPM4_01995, partial [Microbacterium sp. AGC62]